MAYKQVLIWCLLTISCYPSTAKGNDKPNIIFMLGDDLGFNEFGYNECTETATPFINDLVTKESLLLLHNYVWKVCSPSRASFLTGRYPSSLGLQNLVFNIEFPASLTRQVSTLSNELKHNGYSTHLIGSVLYTLISIYFHPCTLINTYIYIPQKMASGNAKLGIYSKIPWI